MNTSVHEENTAACQRALQATGADAVVLFPSPNMFYLSGFEDEPMERHLLLFVTGTETLFVAPELYGSEIEEESHVESVWTWSDSEDPIALLERAAAELDISGGHVLVDDTMWAQFTQDLEQTLPGSTFGLASEVLEDLRITKSGSELDALRGAAERSDAVSERIRELGDDVVGTTERELATRIESMLTDEGCSGASFEPIVGSGPNGAKPHHRNSDRTIQANEPVVLDFGGWFERYPGDQTRTIVFEGDPSSTFEAAYAAVLEALEAGVEAVEPGIPAETVDHTVRDVIEQRGFGEQFIHRTGHGVGLDVHEPPYIVDGNQRELDTGMVFSIEPGIYIDDEFGVRIEDLVVVTENGCDRLNDSPRAWRPT